MKFDKTKYLNEMHALIDKAIQKLRTEKQDFEIYTCSIWTDPNAAVSSINIESKKNNDLNVTQSNEWSKKYFDMYIIEGDFEQAKLFEPIARNCNPADFELRDFEIMSNSSLPTNWEEETNGACWDELEPALYELGAYTLEKISREKIHPDFELSVNDRHDWYGVTFRIE